MPHFTSETNNDQTHETTSHDEPPYEALRSGPFALSPSINWPPTPPQSRRTSGPSIANATRSELSIFNCGKGKPINMSPESKRRESWIEQVTSPGSIAPIPLLNTMRPSGIYQPTTMGVAMRRTENSNPSPANHAKRVENTEERTPAARASPSDLRATAPVFVAPSTMRNDTAVEVIDDLCADIARANLYSSGERTRHCNPLTLDSTHLNGDLSLPHSSEGDMTVPSTAGRYKQMSQCFGAIGTRRPSETQIQPQPPAQQQPEQFFRQAQSPATYSAQSRELMDPGLGLGQMSTMNPQSNRFSHQAHPWISRPSQSRGPRTPKNQIGGRGPLMRLADFNQSTGLSDKPYHLIQYAVVEFKLYRPEVYEMRMDWGNWESGDIFTVIVEADRGFDLGQVWEMTENYEHAQAIKKSLYRKHWNQLLQYSEDDYWTEMGSDSTFGDKSFEDFYSHLMSQPHNSGSNSGMALKFAVSHATLAHLACLPEKQRSEAKAKREVKTAAARLQPSMEVLDVEFQMDQQKLTIYYVSSHYIDYKALQNELFKHFKCRLWFVALNPASFHPSSANNPRSLEVSSGLQSSGFLRNGPSNQVVDPRQAYLGYGYFASSSHQARQEPQYVQEQLRQQHREETQYSPYPRFQPAAAGPPRHDSGYVGRRSTVSTLRSPWKSELPSYGAWDFGHDKPS